MRQYLRDLAAVLGSDSRGRVMIHVFATKATMSSPVTRMLRHQYRLSRNIGENWPTKCKRAVWAAIFTLKALVVAVKAMRHEQLGSRVLYRGRECFISNWANSASPTLAVDGFYEQHCPRAEIRNVVNFRELLHRFRFGMSFYLDSWHSIDVNKRLYRAEQQAAQTVCQ